MEEIVLSLFEDGTLTRNGEVKIVKQLASLRIPPTVQGTIASRIDRLPAIEKELGCRRILEAQEPNVRHEPRTSGRNFKQFAILICKCWLLGDRGHISDAWRRGRDL